MQFKGIMDGAMDQPPAESCSTTETEKIEYFKGSKYIL